MRARVPRLSTLLYPPSHPYSWPTIGSMEDLSAASRDDVAEFFKTYYAPNNASLVIAGDIDIARRARWLRNGSARSRAGRHRQSPRRRLCSTKSKQTLTDRVQLRGSTWLAHARGLPTW